MEKTVCKLKKTEKELTNAKAAQEALEQERDQKTKTIRDLEVIIIHAYETWTIKTVVDYTGKWQFQLLVCHVFSQHLPYIIHHWWIDSTTILQYMCTYFWYNYMNVA